MHKNFLKKCNIKKTIYPIQERWSFFINFFKKNNNHSLIFSPIVLPEKGNTNIMLQVKSVFKTEISYTERISYWTISRIITT